MNRGRHLSKVRTIIIMLAAMLAAGVSQARADGGTVRISFLKAGFVVGGAVGEGTLNFQGRSCRRTVGGINYGFTFGGSQTYLHGRVSNIYRPSDIEGVYGAAGAGATVIRGPQAIVLTSQKGAVLELSGNQTGLMVNLDLSSLVLSLH
jgi:lipid-binding SYLF domain-containing protein